jgi:GTP cyclohydrolase I
MSDRYFVSLKEVLHAATYAAVIFRTDFCLQIYGIPRGGIPAAMAVVNAIGNAKLIDDPTKADLIIDDILDSGETMRRFHQINPNARQYALFDKRMPPWQGQWLIMPWEVTAEIDQSGHDIVTRLLQFVGENPERGGLRETPHRVMQAWQFMTSGYTAQASSILKCFEDGAQDYDEMVFQGPIPFWSNCEHHLLPFWGNAYIGYIPTGKIIGLSKFSRLIEIFSRRLTVQERLCTQIADTLMEYLDPLGVGVALQCRHCCMESRGVQKPGTLTITTALRGVIKDKSDPRSEFLSAVQTASQGLKAI